MSPRFRALIGTLLVLAALQTPVLAVTAPAPEGYRLTPGDAIAVTSSVQSEAFTNQAPLLQSGRGYPIRPDGAVSLPFLGEVHLAGMTSAEAEALLRQRYQADYGDASFLVNVIHFHDRVVSVIGEVTKPGVYTFEHPPTLMEALSDAGGVTDWGVRDHVKVLRAGKLVDDVDVVAIQTGKASDLALDEHDVVQVDTAWTKPYAQSIPTAAAVLGAVATLLVIFVRVQTN